MAKLTTPSWDLSDLYKGVEDPRIKKDQEKTKKKVDEFNKLYKDKKNIDLVAALKDYSEIINKIAILGNYSYLKFSENTGDPKSSNLYQQVTEFNSNIFASLSWFSIMLSKIDDNTFNKYIKNPKFHEFKHFIETKRALSDFILSEKEENILIRKSVTGSDAFVKLYDQIDSSLTFELKINKKIEKLTLSQISQITKNHPDRKLRQKAYETISETLSNPSNAKLHTFILNTLLLDKKINDEIREHKYPQEATFINYETPKEVVNAMVSAISKHWDIGERYYKAKSKLLGYKLHEWDRYSDIYQIKDKQKVDWRKSKEIILESFSSFSKEFKDIANLFFEKNWIDAQVRKGKMGGAYCSYVSPEKHPFVFLNFNESLEDTMTLGHELGHAIHGYLGGKNNNVLEFDASTAVAEIASIFAEAIVFDKLISQARNKREKINLLAGKIQGSFATVLRQTAFYLFESEIHTIRRERGELTTEEFNSLYQKHLQPMFGKGLTLTDIHKWSWMPIAHFYHYNFYVYSYAFGELLAISLYGIYKKEGQTFVDKYIKALSAGGSLSPTEITKMMGVDITKQNFWESGLKLIEQEVEEFEKLVLE